jgi:uncharacterized protein
MPQRHQHRTFTFPDISPLTLAVLSDTHGKPHPGLFPVLERHPPSLILHAGDIGDTDLLKDLETISDLVFVRGNVDPAGPDWPDSVSLHLGMPSGFRMNLLLLHVAIGQMKLQRTALNLLRRHPAEIVIFGHSHIPFLGTEGKIVLFNPGSAGPVRWQLPITMGLIAITQGQLTFKHVDLRTGEFWKPA